MADKDTTDLETAPAPEAEVQESQQSTENQAQTAPGNEEAPTPAGDAPTPNEEAPAPTEESPASTEEAPAQAEEAPTQAEEAPAPTEEAPAQAEEAPAQAEEAPTQAEESPAPTEEAPTQAEEAPTQAEDAPAPTEESPTPENEDEKELQSWKEDAAFMEFLKEKGINDISPDNAEAVREFHKEYKERQNQDNNDGKEQESEMNVGGEEGQEEGQENQEENTDEEEANRDTNTMDEWKKWAEDHNYLFEDTQEKDWEYSFNLYKSKEDMEAKNPSTTVKGKGDTLMVKSDDLEVYREIARQAKEKGYTSINLKDTLSPEQAQMMALAALEQGLDVKGNTQEIDLNNETFKDLSEESKKKAEEYNNRIAQEKPQEETNQQGETKPQEAQQEGAGNTDSLQTNIEKAIAAAKEFKEKNPEGTIGYPKTNNPEIMAANIYAAHVAGCKIEDTGGFVTLPLESIKNLPADHKQGVLTALGAYNTAMGNKMAEQAKETLEKLHKGEKVNGIEVFHSDGPVRMSGYKITETDPTKRAILFATIMASYEGGKSRSEYDRPFFEPPVDNVAAGVAIQYLPEKLRSILSRENFEARKRQRDEILQRRENATGKDKEYFDAHKQLRSKETPKEGKASALDVVKQYQEQKRRGM